MASAYAFLRRLSLALLFDVLAVICLLLAGVLK